MKILSKLSWLDRRCLERVRSPWSFFTAGSGSRERGPPALLGDEDPGNGQNTQALQRNDRSQNHVGHHKKERHRWGNEMQNDRHLCIQLRRAICTNQGCMISRDHAWPTPQNLLLKTSVTERSRINSRAMASRPRRFGSLPAVFAFHASARIGPLWRDRRLLHLSTKTSSNLHCPVAMSFAPRASLPDELHRV
jgi:hypothetical protein